MTCFVFLGVVFTLIYALMLLINLCHEVLLVFFLDTTLSIRDIDAWIYLLRGFIPLDMHNLTSKVFLFLGKLNQWI